MATDAILETIKPRRSEEQLPVTTAGTGIELRRRISSFSAMLGSCGSGRPHLDSSSSS